MTASLLKNREALRSLAKRLDLPPCPRIRYTRKSTEEDTRQIASHEQQQKACDNKWGPTNTGIAFEDSQTGTTFARPGMNEMVGFCRNNKQPKTAKGVIEIYDMSRFGRILTDGEEDPYAVMEQMKLFERLGWEIRFCTVEKTGNPMMDFLQNGIFAIMAAEVSKKLKRDTRRGRNFFLSLEGGARWMGGKPPLGTYRADPTETDADGNLRRLAWGERAPRGGSILCKDGEENRFLEEGMRMCVRKEAYTVIADYWNRNGVRTEYGRRWEHRAVQFALINPALAGFVVIDHRDPATNEITAKTYKAAWDYLVDEELYRACKAEVERRQRQQSIGPRSGMVRSLLSPICAKCGVPWYATRIKKGGKTVIGYTHPADTMRLTPEWAARIKAHGCKHWYVDANVIEAAIRDLVLQSRTSPEFAQHLRAVINDRGDLEDSARSRKDRAEKKLQGLEDDLTRAVANLEKAQKRQMDDAAFWESIDKINEQMAEVRKERDAALDMEKAANGAWDTIRELLDETKNLESIWESGDFEKRRQILDWWVRQVLIVVDQEPGKRRSGNKYALVFLRTAPTEGLDVLIAGKEPTTSPDEPTIVGGGNTGTRSLATNNGECYVLELPRFQEVTEQWKARASWVKTTFRALFRGRSLPAPIPYKRKHHRILS